MFRDHPIVFGYAFFLIAGVLGAAKPLLAQHHGGGRGISIGYTPGRPDAVEEKDDLKDYHHLLAVQATSQQVTEFQSLLKTVDDAKATLAGLGTSGKIAPSAVVSLDQAVQSLRAGEQKFEEGFSEAQKSGLKKVTKRLEHSDSELDRTSKRLDQITQHEGSEPEISAAVTEVNKSLSEFSNDQLALAKEMSIILADDSVFTLPESRKQVSLANQTITLGVTGSLSQSRIEGNVRTFQIDMMADLSDLEQNVDAIMKAGLSEEKNCGERLQMRHATLTSLPPDAALLLQLHYERWSCIGGFSHELAESDGSVELKLTPAVDRANSLTVNADLKRIDANGMMESSLRSGTLGEELREKVAHIMLTLVRSSSDFKAVLPVAIRSAAQLDRLNFESSAGRLKLRMIGSVQLSNEQVQALANELNQTLAAQSAQASHP